MTAEPARRGSLLILSEDSSGYDTVRALVERTLLRLVRGFPPDRLSFQPIDSEARNAVHGNLWKSRNPRDREAQVQMVRAISRALERPNGFVFFHVDADRAWSLPGPCENAEQFEARVRAKVRLLLAEMMDADAVELALGRLFLLMPYYSIEAWLLQHTAKAIELCAKHYQGRDREQFEAWQRDRTLLDEVDKPKAQTCLRDRHNAELAGKGFPADEVYAAERSYHASIEPILACEPLRTLLEQAASYP